MNEKEVCYRAGHAYCNTCKATFPVSWLQTRGALRKDGQTFCSQKCADNYNPATAHMGITALMSGNMSGID